VVDAPPSAAAKDVAAAGRAFSFSSDSVMPALSDASKDRQLELKLT
jgi:hypothetical protein